MCVIQYQGEGHSHYLAGHPLCPTARCAQTNRFAIRKNGPGKRAGADAAEAGTDYSSKLLHLAWHPEANVIAAAASNSLYMYCA